MSKHGGPEGFGFWKSIIIGLFGIIIIITGLALFEVNLWISIILVLIGAFIVLIAAEGGKGKMRGIMRDPHSLTMKNHNKSNLNKDLPYNPWDEVSKDKK